MMYWLGVTALKSVFFQSFKNWKFGVFEKNDSKNSIKNGIIVLKGGDLNEELKSVPYKTIIKLNKIFDYEYFQQKQIVYIPQG